MLQNIRSIFNKLNSMMKVNKLPGDWSLTSFLSSFAVIVPMLLWVVISSLNGELVPMPESMVVVIIVGITGKVYDKKQKLNGNSDIDTEIEEEE